MVTSSCLCILRLFDVRRSRRWHFEIFDIIFSSLRISAGEIGQNFRDREFSISKQKSSRRDRDRDEIEMWYQYNTSAKMRARGKDQRKVILCHQSFMALKMTVVDFSKAVLKVWFPETFFFFKMSRKRKKSRSRNLESKSSRRDRDEIWPIFRDRDRDRDISPALFNCL